MAPLSPNTPDLSPLSRCPSLKPCRDGCSSRPPLPHRSSHPCPGSPASLRVRAPTYCSLPTPWPSPHHVGPDLHARLPLPMMLLSCPAPAPFASIHTVIMCPASILRGCDPPAPARPTLQHALPFPLRPRRRPTGPASRWGSGT
jgi:hypothetical protein